MKPDASQYNPDPAYLRSLIERAGLTQLARRVMPGAEQEKTWKQKR